MKPKPFVELNHFTVPVLMMNPFNGNISIHGATRHAILARFLKKDFSERRKRNKTNNKLPNTETVT
jgi:beta-glucosidase/6-phospho-beta-glucosidase/beta-galactosidase